MVRPIGFPETHASLLATLGEVSCGHPAWREFFERYAPAIYRVARQQGLAEPDADDIVQQVMIVIASHVGNFHYDRDRGRFRQWVRTVTQNKIREAARGRQLPTTGAGVLPYCAIDQPSPAEVWEREWRIQDMLWCLDQVAMDFSPRRMEAFRLYVLEGLAAAKTARRMGMRVGHIYVIRAQVINKVRQLMRNLEAPDA